MANTEFQTEDFAKYFLAMLISNGRKAFRLHDRSDQQAILRLLNLIVSKIEEYKAKDSSSSSREYRELVKLRNMISPNSIGAFDGFESLLRKQQGWLTSSQNPYLEVIKFDLPKERATDILDDLDNSTRNFYELASKAYMGEEGS